LKRLDEEETKAYIKHRLAVVGGDPDLFDDEACEAVFMLSNGTPRIINRICDLALVYGFAEEKQLITAEVMLEVTVDKVEVENSSASRLGLAEFSKDIEEQALNGNQSGVGEAVAHVQKELQSHLGHAMKTLRKMKLPRF